MFGRANNKVAQERQDSRRSAKICYPIEVRKLNKATYARDLHATHRIHRLKHFQQIFLCCFDSCRGARCEIVSLYREKRLNRHDRKQ
jgi:hypothetical protein